MLIEAQPLDFTVIGAPRSGAGWLASMLSIHPEIAIATRSGPGFFADRHPFRAWPRRSRQSQAEDSRALRRLFNSAPPDALLGEVAPLTYFDPLSASRQSNLCPDSQVIVLLRNPIDMLHSLYRHGRRLGWWGGSFEQVIAAYPSLIELAFYDRHLTPYRDWFPAANLHVVLTEHLFTAEYETLEALLQFLEVESEMLPPLPARNTVEPLLTSGSGPVGYGTRIRRCWHAARRRLGRTNGSSPPATPTTWLRAANGANEFEPALAADTRLYLLDELDADISRLEGSFGLDLRHWRSEQTSMVAALPDNVVRLPVHGRTLIPALDSA